MTYTPAPWERTRPEDLLRIKRALAALKADFLAGARGVSA